MGSFDLVIRNGKIIDGTGAAARHGDVAVKDGVIVEVGAKIAGTARETIDAEGRLVTPGFVDVHTHYDGQITWDATLEPSFSHGVTTIVTGNCGVGFAPVRPDGHRQLIELMEGVEDIPGTALWEGIRWNWESFPDYLDAIAGRAWTMDVATQVPHGAIRAYVMGERGVKNEAATAEDVRQMAQLVEQAMEAGAVGFSTSRIIGHQALDGTPVPGTFAGEDEVFALGKALARTGGVFQLVPGGSVGTAGQNWKGEQTLAYEIDWMARLSREAHIPVTYLIVEHDDDPDAWKEAIRLTEIANRSGARLYPQTASRPAGFLTGFQSQHMFQRRPTYMALAALPFDQRMRELAKPEVRAAILSESDAPPKSASINDNLHLVISAMLPRNIFPLGAEVDYEPPPETAVAVQARREGVEPQARLYDLMLEQDGRAMLLMPGLNYSRGNGDAIFAMLSHPDSIVGLADGGAHCGFTCDASSSTYLLTHWVRGRTRGPRLKLEYAIRKQTRDTAALYGLTDRGIIAPGKRADLNVIDFDRLTLKAPYATRDLPAGGQRILQAAEGYGATVVNGVVTRRDDRDTGARPGRLVRGRTSPAALAAE
ncbi:MAG: amidohydrolase family protein [Alphaproteobacteria bacterium]|nr:amidohydrolase family protein [Alphaproteobacteria bacterium]